MKSITRKSKLKLLVIGKVEKGDGKVFLIDDNGRRKEASLLDDRGYIHLVGRTH
jgi:hypothetical protein